jgi:hypothetical protein
MNVETGAEAALFPGKEYIIGIAVAVQLSAKPPVFCKHAARNNFLN